MIDFNRLPTNAPKINLKNSLSKDEKLVATEDYQKIVAIVSQIDQTGVLIHAAGNCIAISEILLHLLQQSGISAKIVECRAMSTKLNARGQVSEFKYLGYDGGEQSMVQGFVDTHAVVITETESPILIDLAARSILPSDRLFVIEALNSLDPDILLSFDVSDSQKIVYYVKKNPRLLGLHQSNLMSRIKQDLQSRRLQRKLTIAVIALAGLTVVNFLLNSFLVIMKMMYP